MEKLGVQFDAAGSDAAQMAGSLWRHIARSKARGSVREHLIPDFLVGAHALLQAEILLSRDRGFYRQYFSKLRVIDASTT